MTGPATLGRYQIERVLGKGAMGVVYQALDPKLHRKVAIKTILISQLDEATAKDFSARFVREAHAVARLNHPNIVQVYDFGEEQSLAYLVMEFIRGNELRSVLGSSGTFDRNESVRIMGELLDALDFAHEQGVIHRDIKPANVMLDSQGRVKLTDFGVARLTDSDRTSAERTQAGTMVGTPAYMSPEQIQGLKVDRRSDIFSAGIILYQFLTGQKPFVGEGAWTVAKKIIQDEPPLPSSLNVAVTPQLDRVVAKALAKQPDDRFPTAREFAAALRQAAQGKDSLASSAEPTVVVRPEPDQPKAQGSGEMDLEFWRSIKDSDDPNDFELYMRQFPKGVYATLATRRAARLRGFPVEEGSESSNTRLRATGASSTTTSQTASMRAGLDSGTLGRTVSDKTIKLQGSSGTAAQRGQEVPPATESKRSSILVPVILGLVVAAGLGGYFATRPGGPLSGAPGAGNQEEARARREAEAQKAAEKARMEAEQAKRAAEGKAREEAESARKEEARRAAEAQARREAEARAQREAEAKALREAQAKRQAAVQAQAEREAEERIQREAQDRARREAQAKRDAQARREAEAKAQREAQSRRDAELRAKREAETTAKREAEAAAKREAETKAKLAAEETTLWNSVRRSRDPAEFQKYLSRYPNGKFASDARAQITALESARAEEEKKAKDAEAKRRQAAEKKKGPIVVPPTF